MSKNVSEEADAERVWNLAGSGVKDLGHGGRFDQSSYHGGTEENGLYLDVDFD